MDGRTDSASSTMNRLNSKKLLCERSVIDANDLYWADVRCDIMKDKIGEIIRSVTNISSTSVQSIIDLSTVSTLEKGELISKVGRRNGMEYFVIDGICKSYLHNQDGDEVTLSFFMSGSVISPHTTRVRNESSLINLRALTPVVVAAVDAHAFEELMVHNLEIRHFGNTVLRNELMDKVEKEIGLASLTAKSRLEIMRRRYPNLENLIPHSDIASYLGITTISLSRIRGQF